MEAFKDIDDNEDDDHDHDDDHVPVVDLKKKVYTHNKIYKA